MSFVLKKPTAFLLVGALLASLLASVAVVAVSEEPADAAVFFNTDDEERTYKEYWADHSTYTGGCDENGNPALPGGQFYIEPMNGCTKEIELEIPDNVQNAEQAVIYVDLWRNRPTRSARFTVNDGPQFRPNIGDEFSRTPYVALIALDQLTQGTNILKFQEFSGAYHVHDVMVRVYYNATQPIIPGPGSDVTPPSGQLTRISAGGQDVDPAAGGVLNVDSNQVTLEASASGAAYVEFHAFYEGFDEDNDGITRDWHSFLRNNWAPGGTNPRPTGATIGHIGTDGTGPYTATWNLPDVVSQSGVKFKVRIVDSAGNVRETALPPVGPGQPPRGVSGEFTLSRSYSVETYRNPNFKDLGIYFDGEFPQDASTTVELPADLSNVTRAILVGNYWERPRVSLNGFPTFDAVPQAVDSWVTQKVDLDVGQLRPGTNTLYYSFRPPGFGHMIEKPGPTIVIHRSLPDGAPVVTSQPNDVVAAEGTRATFTATATGAPTLAYQWLRNGVAIPGATSASYTTPAVTTADNLAAYSVVITNGLGSDTSDPATLTVAASQGGGAWYDDLYRYRIPITVAAQGAPREDHIVETVLNFSDLMSAAGSGGPTFDPDSVRVVEVDAAGTVLNDNVPRQLDRLASYDPVSRAEMNLIFMMTGTTPANQVRRYHIYFDKLARNIPPVVTPPQLTVTDNVIDQGFNSFQFDLADGSSWVFHKTGGGFAKIIDRNGNDWVAWNPATGSAGDFRGVPNAVKPPAGFFHPGRTTSNTAIVTTDAAGNVGPGPLKTTIRVQSNNGSWVSFWDIYPTRASFQMTRAAAQYWFLYEGLPGGAVEFGNDIVVRSDGVQVPIDGSFETDLPQQEWVYAADQALGRSFYMAHHQDDGAVESYRILDNQMPILAFGRSVNDPYISRTFNGEPHRFTVGLVDATAFAEAGPQVRGAYQDVGILLGTPEFGGEFLGPFSDDFGATALQSFWRYEDPAGDVPSSLNGREFVMDIPAGSSHDLWSGVDLAPRLVQDMGNTDFDLMVKFNSLPTQRFQGQGLFFRSPEGDLLRFTLEHDGTRAKGVVARIDGGVGTVLAQKNFSGSSGTYVRVVRSGDTFRFERSFNGTRMFTVGTPLTIPFEVAEVGIFGFATSPTEANSPAFPVVVDYFENKALPGFDNDAPIIENLSVNPSSRGAAVTWTTSVPAQTILDHGPTVLLGSRSTNEALTTTHRVDLDFLDCNAPHFYRVEARADAGVSQSPTLSFTTADCAALISDDFSTPSLQPIWNYVDPVGGAVFALTGTNAVVSIPTGVRHNLFVDANEAVRLRQEAPVGDFQAEAKFDSVLSVPAPTDNRRRFQMQGLVVEQDEDTFLRFEIHHDGEGVKAYAAFIDGPDVTTLASGIALPASASHYMRVTRVGNTWLYEHSIDGSTWSPVVTANIGIAPVYVSPYFGTTATGTLTPPSFVGSLDYFFNTALPIDPEDGGAGLDTEPPVITDIVAVPANPNSQSATISWTTDEPSTTRVVWGLSPGTYGFGPVVDNLVVRNHAAAIGPLNCGVTYHFQVASTDPVNNTTTSPNQTLVMPPCPAAVESDDFSRASLDERWVVTDPLGDGEVTTTGGLLRLTVPAGARHDLTPSSRNALRLTQPVPDTDFQVEATFESAVSFRSQLQGLVFESDANNLVRFDLSYNGSGTIAFVGRLTSSNLVQLAAVPVDGLVPATLRVTRTGTQWTFEYASDGGPWVEIYTGSLPNSVARMGPFAGNANNRLADVPPHTALVDYFFNSASPIDPEDGGLTEAPSIELWAGNQMEIGTPGLAQPDLNIMGQVTDPDGVASLTYSVNGGTAVDMGVGADGRRLIADGDFNANVPISSLNPGLNTVVIRAVDTLTNESEETIEVTYNPGNSWPFPYTVDWSSVTDVYDVAQPIDGRWVVEGDTVRSTTVGYDRLLAFGDDWDSFEAVVPITVNAVNPDGLADRPESGGAGIGFIPHWRGHIQQPGDFSQPPWGFAGQLGALAWYRYRTDLNGERLEIRDSEANVANEDLSGNFKLQLGVPYLFKLRAETGGGAGPRYSLKVWPRSTPEPTQFQLVAQLPPGAPDTGSLLLVAHHVDATFGDLTVTQVTAGAPSINPPSGTFAGLTKVSIGAVNPGAEIRYTLDGSEPTEASTLYTEPFLVTQSATIKARAFRAGFDPSPMAEAPITITPAPARVTSDLIALYTFDEGDGTVVRDSSGFGQPLDLSIVSGTPTWLPDGSLRISEPTVIDSPSSAAKFNDAAKLSQSFAVEAWLDPATVEQLTATIVDIGPGTAGSRNLALTQQARSYEMAIRTSRSNANGEPVYTANGAMPPELHHVIYQRRSSFELELWIDGVRVLQQNRNGLLGAWTSGFGLSIAGDHTGGNPWLGDLHLMALYGRALSQTEIEQNFQAGPDVGPGNAQPIVSAGDDTFVVEGEPLQLSGSASDDGFPDPPATLTTTWSMVSGPGTVTFADPSVPATTATFSVPGTYELELRADDGELAVVDQVTVTVVPLGSAAEAPTITPPGGTYSGTVEVTLASAVPGADIRFTVDGTDPAPDSSPYTGPITVTTDTEVRARVYRDGLDPSPVATASYQIVVNARVTDGLRAMYEFNETSGSRARDTSGVGTALNLNIANRANTAWTGSGLRILAPTTISSGGASKIAGPVRASDEVTVEGWIRPDSTSGSGAKVMTISGSPTARNLALDQTGTTYDWFVRSQNTNTRGEPPLSMGAVATTTAQHVAVTRDVNGVTRTYLDGVEVDATTLPGNMNNWLNTHKVTVGSEANGTSQWLGTIYSLAIYSRALTPEEVVQNYAFGRQEIPADNTAPTVNAGSDLTIVAGSLALLDGTVSDDGRPGGGSLTTAWSKVSGPGTVTFGNVTNVDTTATFSQPGVYVLALSADDSAATTSDSVTVTVLAQGSPAPLPVATPPGGNYANTVAVALAPSQAIAGSEIRYTIDGSDPTASSPLYTGPIQISGTTTLKARTFHPQLTPSTVLTEAYALANNAPVVDAGADQAIVEGEQAQLDATVVDDGNPVDPGAVTVAWSRVSGPGTVTFGDATATDTTAAFSVPGTYVLRLTADDSAATGSDTVTVEILSGGSVLPTPTLGLAPGAYPGAAVVPLSIGKPLTGLEFRYTVDGSDPTEASELAVDDTVTLTASAELRVRAFRTGLTQSPIRGGIYTVVPPARATDGLQALFNFDEGSGSTISDSSGVGDVDQMTIANPAAVTWLADGLRIDSPTVIAGDSATSGSLNAAVLAANAVTIEVRVTPANASQTNAMVAALSVNKSARNFGVFQDGGGYTWRVRSTATNTAGDPGRPVVGSVTANAEQHLVYTRDATGQVRIYIDGELVNSGTLGGTFANWPATHVFSVGAERDGTKPWLGTLHTLAVYDRALSPTEVLQNYLDR